MIRECEFVAALCRCAWFAFALTAVAGPADAAPEIHAIQFARGASSAEIEGAVIRGEQMYYSIGARRGQTMSLRLSALETNAVFQLYAPGTSFGTDGSTTDVMGSTLSGAGEGDDAMRWAGRLPQSGRYLIVVGPTRGNATYRLTVTVR